MGKTWREIRGHLYATSQPVTPSFRKARNKIKGGESWWTRKKSDVDGFVKSSNSPEQNSRDKRAREFRVMGRAYRTPKWQRNKAQRPAELKRETFYEAINFIGIQPTI